MINKSVIYILLFLFTILSACNTLKKTETDYNKLSETDRIENTSLLIQASKEKTLGNYDRAKALYAQCIKNDPSNATAMYELANILSGQKKYKDALILVKEAVKISPENKWYLISLAQILEKSRKYDEAAKVYENLTKIEPDDINHYIDWAAIYIYTGKPNEAIKVYEMIEKKIGITEEISLQKEKIYISLNKLDDAVKEIKKLIDEFPNEVNYYSLLAELYLNNGDAKAALETYNKILQINPEDNFIHLSLADYYRKTGDKEKYFEEMKLAFLNKNLDIDSKIGILLLYYTMTEKDSTLKDQAYTLAQILVNVHPMEAKSHSMYADFLYKDKKYKEARDELRLVISLDSSKYIVWEQLLIIESELSDFESMAKEAKQASELFPLQPLPFLFFGVANYELKNYNEAIKILKQGTDLVVDNKNLLIQFYTYLADVYYQNKDTMIADKTYEKVLELDPNDPYVLNNYSYYLALRKERLEEAEKMGKKLNELYPNNSAYLDTYGWVLYKMDKYIEAKKWLKLAVENKGDKSAVILEHYGDVLYKLEEFEESFSYWEKAINAGKGSEYLEKKLNDKKLYE